MTDQTGERPDVPGDEDAPPSTPSPEVPELDAAVDGGPTDEPRGPEEPGDGADDQEAPADDAAPVPDASGAPDATRDTAHESDAPTADDTDVPDTPSADPEQAADDARGAHEPTVETTDEVTDEADRPSPGGGAEPEDHAPVQGGSSPKTPAVPGPTDGGRASSATTGTTDAGPVATEGAAEPAAAVEIEEPDVEPGSAATTASPTSGWRRLGAALRPRASRSQVLAGVLCAALGFALVVQVQQSASDQLSSARQEDLVRLLDEVTDRAQQLGDEVSGLESTRDELESGSGQARSALELAEQRAESEGILSGRLPAQGPGVHVTIQDPGGSLKASQMFNVLEELRNAGAEVVELNGVRLVTSTWFEDERAAIVVDGTALSSPYEWTVIGDPETMDRALEIPGGALATVRTAGAEASTTREDEVKITAVTPPQDPEFAQPEREHG
ncbi:DUF881 domain-containing protein [Krasilnikoviella flava]|uniref:Uncharacterized conserved protein YlxW, UPF0749 family n=1 Tax=Krasilnikoviella flava TaxID=526729 RepID=A0A1T5L5P7_9MICO|nr:DUF881 domain-containing protein [Krasilnikoviella flava]SKC71263.1 Uncharacterized conserved protein YlxW, UPF0749 family [Krasilnikoviella flava]